MTSVKEFPLIPVHSIDFPYEGPPCTKRELINGLFAIANSNTDFKRGLLDHVGFKIEQVDRVNDSRMAEEIASIEYSFRACRVRLPERRPRVDFSFGLNARLERIPLPPFITDPLAEAVVAAAMEEGEEYADTLPDDVRAEVASSMWGQYNHVIDHRFYLSNSKGSSLQSIEAHSYRDEDDVEIHEVLDATVHPDGVVYSFDESGEALNQRVTEVFLEQRAHEQIKFEADEHGINDQNSWKGIVLLEQEFSKFAKQERRHEEARKIRVANAVLQRIRRAQLIQAGVKVPRLSRKKSLKTLLSSK